jgi:hypothetical protein
VSIESRVCHNLYIVQIGFMLYFSHVLDRMVVGFTTTYAIRTTDVSSNPTRVIQHYVIKFVNDVRQVCGFLQVLHHDITEILLKVALNTINQTKPTKVCT